MMTQYQSITAAEQAMETRDQLFLAAACPDASSRAQAVGRAEAELERLAAAMGYRIVALEAEAA